MSSGDKTTISTPKTTLSKKRELTSPEFEADSKKNRFEIDLPPFTELPPLPESPEATAMAAETDHGSFDSTSSGAPHILIPPSEMLKLSEMLKETYRGEMSTMVTNIVTGVLQGLQDRISSLEKSNNELKKENKSLTSKVAVLESKADQAEQYSRRNCLRISGFTEDDNIPTDDIVLKLATDTGSSVTLQDIDRSRRIGNPTSPKRKVPRDIEDLTKKRNGYLYEARKLFKRGELKGAWSSDGTILIKDNLDEVHRISSLNDLIPFGYTGCPEKTMPLLIGIYLYIITSTGMHLTCTIREINILQGSAIETTPTPTLLPWLPWKQICYFFRF